MKLPKAKKYPGGWKFAFRHNGILYRRQGFETKNDADKEIRAILGYIDYGRRDVTLNELLDEYLRWSVQDKKKSPAWVKTSKQMLTVFSEHLKLKNIRYPHQINIDHIRTFRTVFARSAKRSDATWEKYRQAISAWLNWANKRDPRIKNYANDEDFKIRIQQNPPETLDQDEIKKILNYFDSRGGMPRIAFRLLLYTGLRLGEMMNLKWTDINLDKKTLSAGTKTKEARTIPLSDKIISYLKELPQETDRVFDNGAGGPLYHRKHWYRLLQEACAIMGVRRHSIHSLRHTFVRNLLEKGVELTLVAKLCGHRDVRTTMRYAAHFSLSNAREAVNLLDYD